LHCNIYLAFEILTKSSVILCEKGQINKNINTTFIVWTTRTDIKTSANHWGPGRNGFTVAQSPQRNIQN